MHRRRSSPVSALVRRALVTLALLVGLVGASGPARAGTRVTVVGDDAAVVAALVKALGEHPEIGVITAPAPPVVSADRAIALAIAHELDAVVAVRTSVSGASWKATVIAYQGRDGSELGRYEVQAAVTGLAAAAAPPLWKKLGGSINGALRPLPGAVAPALPTPLQALPVRPLPTPPTGTGPTTTTPPTGTGPTTTTPPTGTAEVSKRPPTVDPGPARVATAPDAIGPTAGPAIVAPVGPAASASPGRVTVDVALAPVHRKLAYTDDIRKVMRGHSLTLVAVALDATVRPLPKVPVEVTAAVELSLGGSGTADDSATKYTTKTAEWSIGLGYRAKLGPAHATGRLGFGQQSFRIADDSQPGAEQIPDVAYRWIRPGVDVDLALGGRLHAGLGFGWRVLTGTGDLFDAAWFPRGTGGGLDGGAGLRFGLRANLDLFARFEARHYYFSMNPERGDPLIVGGAIDTYLGGSVGASYTGF